VSRRSALHGGNPHGANAVLLALRRNQTPLLAGDNADKAVVRYYSKRIEIHATRKADKFVFFRYAGAFLDNIFKKLLKTTPGFLSAICSRWAGTTSRIVISILCFSAMHAKGKRHSLRKKRFSFAAICFRKISYALKTNVKNNFE
jgi:hypothetical protein